MTIFNQGAAFSPEVQKQFQPVSALPVDPLPVHHTGLIPGCKLLLERDNNLRKGAVYGAAAWKQDVHTAAA